MGNYGLRYRPLRGGIAIFVPDVGRTGTLGLIAQDQEGEQWFVSCHHVLVAAGASFPTGGNVYQPVGDTQDCAVAVLSEQHADPILDCAAAKLLPGIVGVPEVLGLGKLSAPMAPALGMRVLKSGVSTGVTEGVISHVDGDVVKIQVKGNYPKGYDLSNPSDSGSVWVEATSRSPVALHRAGEAFGISRAIATALPAVLARLSLGLIAPVANP